MNRNIEAERTALELLRLESDRLSLIADRSRLASGRDVCLAAHTLACESATLAKLPKRAFAHAQVIAEPGVWLR